MLGVNNNCRIELNFLKLWK